MLGAWAAMAILVAFVLSGLKVLREYQRVVVFRLGRVVGARGPGIIYVIPGIEKAIRIDLRTITMDIPSQDVITKDDVSLKVSAVLYFRVVDPNRAVVAVENYLFATSQNAQTTLRSVCGEVELDQLLVEREKINAHLQSIIDQHTEPWGIKVVQVAIKFIDLPEEMRRVMAHQAEAERRAKIIAAEGEYQCPTDYQPREDPREAAHPRRRPCHHRSNAGSARGGAGPCAGGRRPGGGDLGVLHRPVLLARLRRRRRGRVRRHSAATRQHRRFPSAGCPAARRPDQGRAHVPARARSRALSGRTRRRGAGKAPG